MTDVGHWLPETLPGTKIPNTHSLVLHPSPPRHFLLITFVWGGVFFTVFDKSIVLANTLDWSFAETESHYNLIVRLAMTSLL